MDYFYDAANRLIATANVGTNGGARANASQLLEIR